LQVAIPLGIGSTQNIECIIVNIHVNEYIRRQESHIVGRVPCDQSLEAIKKILQTSRVIENGR